MARNATKSKDGMSGVNEWRNKESVKEERRSGGNQKNGPECKRGQGNFEKNG